MHQRFCIFPSYRPCKFWHLLCLSCSCLFSSLCLSCFLCLSRKTCDWMISKIWRTGNASLSSYLSSMCFLMKNSFFFLCPFLLFFCFLLSREDDHKDMFLFSGNYLCSSMLCKSYQKLFLFHHPLTNCATSCSHEMNFLRSSPVPIFVTAVFFERGTYQWLFLIFRNRLFLRFGPAPYRNA